MLLNRGGAGLNEGVDRPRRLGKRPNRDGVLQNRDGALRNRRVGRLDRAVKLPNRGVAFLNRGVTRLNRDVTRPNRRGVVLNEGYSGVRSPLLVETRCSGPPVPESSSSKGASCHRAGALNHRAFPQAPSASGSAFQTNQHRTPQYPKILRLSPGLATHSNPKSYDRIAYSARSQLPFSSLRGVLRFRYAAPVSTQSSPH